MPDWVVEVASAGEVPESDGWLGRRERTAMARYRVAPRLAEWRTGRWAAKQAVARLSGVDAAQVEVVGAADGAPEAWIAAERLPVSVSISHRDGVAVAVALPAAFAAGCDIERIEPRCPGFAADWFTSLELAMVNRAPATERDLLVTLIWSAKESALKVLRQGLRVDTREVEISVSDGTFDAWVDGRRISGWWRRDGHFVITAAAQEKVR